MKSIVAETLDAGKQDERGRRIATAEEREKLLAAYDTSGLMQRATAVQLRMDSNYVTE
jgi:hypothetical protein